MSDMPFECDLVLKGGITSGVVYPTAIVELSRDHRFHNIGGSSAGAIAAVAAAAAEHGRQAGGGGFDLLNSIPSELAQEDNASGQTTLQRLFVPQPETRAYFDLFWQQRKIEGGAFTRVAALLPTLLGRGPTIPTPKPAALLAVVLPLAAIVWAVLACSPGTIAFAALAVIVGVLAYLVLRAVAGISNMARDAQTAIADNMHGLCNGRSVGTQTGLTDWLHEHIEQLAGDVRHAPGGEPAQSPQPLTYGDLVRYGIGLVTLTTNLSQTTSETFPFSDQTWAFKPDDMRTLFPELVASFLEERGRVATESSEQRAALEAAGLLQLPKGGELPVLLGARISLSFPVVISAIPLWRLTPIRRDGEWVTEYRQVWLSDGGICSNMPVHLFDHPLPSRPTYAINLGTGATDGAAEPGGDDSVMARAHRNVWRPIRTGSGAGAPIAGITSTGQLLGAVLTTMQNWSDYSATRALGIRDRVCTIKLSPKEGGMNLDMPSTTITGLAPRGKAAGENLGWMVRGAVPAGVGPVDQPDEAATQWTRHRWTRLRSTSLGAGRYADDVGSGWTKPAVPQHGPQANNLTYAELAADAKELLYLPYRSDWSITAGDALTKGITALSEIDFGTANNVSKPPFRPLILSTRGEPATELKN